MQDTGWLKSVTNMPILIKGVLTREVQERPWKQELLGWLSRTMEAANSITLLPIFLSWKRLEGRVRRRVIEMLKDEFELILALSGCLVSRILPGAT
ncbi:hypothetical protein ACFX11_024907 [Malus domestica]